MNSNGKDEDSQTDYEITESGITSNLDITNILLQYFHWPESTGAKISHCNLNMEKALKRCMSVYGLNESGGNTCEVIVDNGFIRDTHRFMNAKLQN